MNLQYNNDYTYLILSVFQLEWFHAELGTACKHEHWHRQKDRQEQQRASFFSAYNSSERLTNSSYVIRYNYAVKDLQLYS